MSKIGVNPWNFDQIFAVFGVFLREMASEEFKNYRIIQTSPEYTIPENLVRIGLVVSENKSWIKKTRSYTADAVWYRQPTGQPTNTVMLNSNQLLVEKVSWQWSVGRVTVPQLSTWHDVPWRSMTWHDTTWRGMTWHEVARRDMTWHDVTWRDITWHDVAWHDIRWNYVTWRNITWLTWITWHDVTWRDVTQTW